MKHITTDEAYRVFLKKRSGWMLGVLAIGIFSFSILFLAISFWDMDISRSQVTLYTSFGIAFIAVSVIQLIKNRVLLHNEEKLHQARISSSDERNLQIASKASRWALMVLLIAMYLVMLIGGLWYPILYTTLSYLICLFLIVYLVAWHMIGKRL